MTKTAKQMFEELGWKCVGETGDKTGIIYERIALEEKWQKIIDKITFYNSSISTVSIWYEWSKKKNNFIFSRYTNVNLNAEELQAINKQVEELGWKKLNK